MNAVWGAMLGLLRQVLHFPSSEQRQGWHQIRKADVSPTHAGQMKGRLAPRSLTLYPPLILIMWGYSREPFLIVRRWTVSSWNGEEEAPPGYPLIWCEGS